MATSFTTTDCYNTVCDALMEPFRSGLYPGLSLGIVTEAEFLELFAVILADFVNRTGLVWTVFTQQIQFNQPTYQFPENLNEAKVAFVNGQYIDHSTLFDLDDWQYSWQSAMGTPVYWYSDGLAPKTIGVALNPDYSGASYTIPTDPSAQPPFGITGLFNGATPGQYTGSMSITGTVATWLSGPLFDLNWNNYYPLPNIVSLGNVPVVVPIAAVTDTTHLFLAIAPGDGTFIYTINIGLDGNLTIVGTTGLSSATYTLDEIIPVVPDSFCVYLAYGVLARIFSTDGEAKDLQRSYYCQARYMEGANLAAAVSGEMLVLNG